MRQAVRLEELQAELEKATMVTWYPLVNSHSYGKSPLLMGKTTINGSFSIAMLNYQRVPEMSDY